MALRVLSISTLSLVLFASGVQASDEGYVLVQQRAVAVTVAVAAGDPHVYARAAWGSTKCNPGEYKVISKNMCIQAASNANTSYTESRDPSSPHGCLQNKSSNAVTFNSIGDNIGNQDVAPMCVPDLAYVVSNTLTEACPPASEEIATQAACSLAAQKLNVSSFTTGNIYAPSGCLKKATSEGQDEIMFNEALSTGPNKSWSVLCLSSDVRNGTVAQNQTNSTQNQINQQNQNASVKMVGDPHVLFNGKVTSIHLPIDRFTNLLRQGPIAIFARGGPEDDLDMNFMYDLSVRVDGREVARVAQRRGRLQEGQLLELQVEGGENWRGVSEEFSAANKSLTVKATPSSVRFVHRPTGLEFVVRSRPTARKHARDSHHLNLNFERGLLTEGPGAARGALPQIVGMEDLTAEVAALMVGARQSKNEMPPL